MYGIVNNALKDLVLTAAGPEAWIAITQAAGYEGISIEDTKNYDDDVTLKIVATACEHLGMELEDVLYSFGRHWVLFTENKGWAKHFMLPADSFLGVLEGLDELHTRVKDAMPDGDMPFFNLSKDGHDYTLEYHSSREGLAPMVLGIIDGLAERFGEKWQCEQVRRRQEWGFDTFALKLVKDGVGDA